MGESPGMRYMRSSRKNQGPVDQTAPVVPGAAQAAVHGGLQRQHKAHRGVQTLVEHAPQAGAFQFVVELAVERVNVDRQLRSRQR
jgi:hypothetical protein